jgi:hypothetical protein
MRRRCCVWVAALRPSVDAAIAVDGAAARFVQDPQYRRVSVWLTSHTSLAGNRNRIDVPFDSRKVLGVPRAIPTSPSSTATRCGGFDERSVAELLGAAATQGVVRWGWLGTCRDATRIHTTPSPLGRATTSSRRRVAPMIATLSVLAQTSVPGTSRPRCAEHIISKPHAAPKSSRILCIVFQIISELPS